MEYDVETLCCIARDVSLHFLLMGVFLKLLTIGHLRNLNRSFHFSVFTTMFNRAINRFLHFFKVFNVHLILLLILLV